MPQESSCTPEGGLEALADALFNHHRFEIPCEGEGQHAPLTKDKAGRKDLNGRLYRYWTCHQCQPRTKRNCRSYIGEAERVLGRRTGGDLASKLLNERRADGRSYDLLDSWLRGKLTPTSVSASSRNLKKRKRPEPLECEAPGKRCRATSDLDIATVPSGDPLQAAYAAREAIGRLIESLTDREPVVPTDPTTPTPTPSLRPPFDDPFVEDLDVDEAILLPTPPSRAPLRPLATNASSSRSSPDLLRSLVSRFRTAAGAEERNAARKEAKRLGLAAQFEAARSKGTKSTSVPTSSTA